MVSNIYLDYMATTPVDPRVVAVMQNCLSGDRQFGNPSSLHYFGFEARALIDQARTQVANLIHATPADIIWTSGATESINLALKGAALFYQRQGRHIITMATEHKAVLETCRYLQSIGFEVTYLLPEKSGLLSLDVLKAAIRQDTMLASIMHVNNETGVIQDIESMGVLLREKGVLFHVDAAQSVGKLSIDVKKMSIDLLSMTAHKIYGPKGIGALYVRRQPRVQLIAQMLGGDADNFLRAGTLPTHQIAGMGKAFEIAAENRRDDMQRIALLRDRLWKNISVLDGIILNGDEKKRIAGCLNIQIKDIDADQFLKALSTVAISTGSACNAIDPEPSHVLLAMGLSRVEANRSFRLSIGRFTTDVEIDVASEYIIKTVSSLRG
ncbi:MAG: aminotransferase class V-fold PLP-dependent enzyme [Coxiellaceae bacterium]|nr:aminotransferase class V-fold PLP-dependent enzyme [Coxiellaceae bacterium]